MILRGLEGVLGGFWGLFLHVFSQVLRKLRFDKKIGFSLEKTNKIKGSRRETYSASFNEQGRDGDLTEERKENAKQEDSRASGHSGETEIINPGGKRQ